MYVEKVIDSFTRWMNLSDIDWIAVAQINWGALVPEGTRAGPLRTHALMCGWLKRIN